MIAVALFGCGVPGVKGNIAKAGWIELSSENFHLVTDMDLDDARTQFRRLEQIRWALVDTYSLILPNLRLPPQRFRIVHFDSCKDFREAAGEGVGGYVTRTPDFQLTPLMVTCEGGGHATMVHELSHVINGAVFPDMPLWLNEGLASYYETLRVRDGAVRIGEFLTKYKPIWQQATFLLGLDELRAADAKVFYDLDRRSKNYFAAWKAVHMLNTKYHAQFRRYMAGLAGAMSDADAWSAAFAQIPADKLGEDYRYYQNRTELLHYQAPYHYRGRVAVPEVRKLRPGEVHAVWVSLQILRSLDRDSRSEARAAIARHLELMAADDPEWPEVLLWRAIASARSEESSTAVEILREYVKRAPDDHRGWNALVSLQLPDADGLGPAPPPGVRSIEPDVMELVRTGQSAADLNLVGWYFALSHRAKTGLNFAQRSIAARPSCGSCWDTLALLHYRDGKPALAAATQKRAIAMMGDAAPGANAMARLEAYRRAAGAAKTNP
jgi:hypothetical protein